MINYKFITKEEFLPLIKKHRSDIFKDTNDIDTYSLYTEEEKQKIAELDKMCLTDYKLYLTAWDDQELIAWSWGFQISGIEFYMCNSAVFPAYRQRGIYTELMKQIITKAHEDGFQEISSKHHPDNNAVLIPKLKAGFVIQGFEVNLRFGLLVKLVHYKSKAIIDIYHERTGFRKSTR